MRRLLQRARRPEIEVLHIYLGPEIGGSDCFYFLSAVK